MGPCRPFLGFIESRQSGNHVPAVAAVARCKVLLQFVLKRPRRKSLAAMSVSNSSVAAANLAGDEKLAATPEATACTIYLHGAVPLALAVARRLSVNSRSVGAGPCQKNAWSYPVLRISNHWLTRDACFVSPCAANILLQLLVIVFCVPCRNLCA